jgi:hypothetical protein
LKELQMKIFARVSLDCPAHHAGRGAGAGGAAGASTGPTVSSPHTVHSVALKLLQGIAYGVAAFGAIRVKDTATLSKKFVRNASAAAGDYKTGVEQAGQDWQTRTSASGDNYASGVQAAIGRKAFERGVSEAGAGKYVTRASTLGAQRYPTGVGAAEGDWAKGAQPYLDELKGMELPPRRPKGDPGNQARANAVAARLRARKVGAA